MDESHEKRGHEKRGHEKRGHEKHGIALRGVIVVLAILVILAVIGIPAIQHMRETARREACQHRMTQLGLALNEYHVAMLAYPHGTINPSGPIQNAPQGFHHNWISGLLPRLNLPEVAEAVDSSVSVYAPENEPVRQERLPVLQCPSTSRAVAATGDYPASHYAGSHHSVEAPIAADNNGVFILNRQITQDDIVDGLQYTLMVGEKLVPPDDLGWLSGTRATLRNTGHPIDREQDLPSDDPLYVGGFRSAHPGGVHLLIADGQVRFTNTDTDQKVLEQLANRHNSQFPSTIKPSAAGR